MSFYDKTMLSNGAVVVSETIPDVRSVTIGFWVGVGSRSESAAENGMSHFIEHLLFKGTEKRNAKQISEAFDRIGAELNAFTTKEFTCFYTRLLDDHLDLGIDVLTDMLQNTAFAPDHIDFERQVILEEIAMYEDTPDEIIHDLFTSALWGGHPLGKQVLGTRESVEAFTREMVVEYFQNNYRPENMVIAAAGNLEHGRLVELVNSYFQGGRTGKPTWREVAVDSGRAVKVYTRPTEQVHICYGTTSLNSRDPKRFILSILENIIGGSMSSRLFQKIREERGLAYSAYSYHSLYRDSGNIVFYVGTRPANVNEVLEIIQGELEDIKNNGVSAEELSRAREHIKGQLVLGLESTRNRMTRLGKSELTHGEILSIDELIERVKQVGGDDIRRLARETFSDDKMVLTIIGPVEKENLIGRMGMDE